MVLHVKMPAGVVPAGGGESNLKRELLINIVKDNSYPGLRVGLIFPDVGYVKGNGYNTSPIFR